ncbi:MAG: hypothetical protein ACKPJJ_37660, partial [Planctomycetaceae bacterium]
LLAKTNIGGPDPEQDLNIHVFGLQATAGTGAICLRSSDFLRINGTGLRTQGDNGDIQVTTAAGGLEISGEVSARGTGNIDLTAVDDIKVRFKVASDAGHIRLTGRRIDAEADGDIFTGAAGSL